MNNKRNQYLDLLKTIMAFTIVMHHYQQLTGRHFQAGINFWNGSFPFEKIVELFFVLSGFLAYLSVAKTQKSTVWHYMKKKLASLLPMPAASIVVYELLTIINHMSGDIVVWEVAYKPDIKGTLISLLQIQAWGITQNPQINNPLWYVSVLMLCHLLFAFISNVIPKILRIPLYVGLIGVGIRNREMPFANEYCTRGYLSFFTGVLLAIFALKAWNILKKSLPVIALAFATEVLLFKVVTMNFNETIFLNFVLYPTLVIMVFILGERFSDIKIRLIGISYDIYVWHIPVLFVAFLLLKMSNYDITIMRQTSVVIVYLAVVALVSFASARIRTAFRKKCINAKVTKKGQETL